MRFVSFPTPRPGASLAALLCLWWFSNNIYAIDAEKLFTRFPYPLLYIDLTFFQLALGLLLTHLHTVLNPSTSHSSLPHPNLVYLIPTLHYLATLLTNISYSTLGSTTTLLWKLCEPASAALLNRLILSQSPTPLSFLGLLVTLFGVFRFSSSSFSVPTFSPIILSNILFPLRNVCIKFEQEDPKLGKRCETEASGIPRFREMLRRAMPLATVFLVLKSAFYGIQISAIPYMLRNASLFTAYQLASFILLERLDALTHSLLNTLKRFTGILLSMIVLSTPLTAPHFQGIAATITGFVLYLVGRKRQKFGTSVIGMAVIAAFVVMATVAGIDEFVDGRTANVSLVDRFSSTANDVSQEKDGEYLVTLLNDYRKRRRSVLYNSYEEVAADAAGNVGNLVWQYGAHIALPDFGNVKVCEFDSRQECAVIAGEKGLKHAIYNPQANTFDPSVENMFRGAAKSIMRDGGETLIVGAGVQVEFREDSEYPEFNSKAKITFASEDYKHPNASKIYLQAMENTGGQMLLRGEFSVNVTRLGGFSRAYSIGCPSFWINEDVHFGKSLEKKYKAIANRRGDKSLKIAVNLKKMDGFHRQIKFLRDNYPNARFYAQSPGDMVMLENLDVPFERTRYFSNVEDWIADLKEMDVGYGVRIHGNMICLGAGLPTFIVASDWRVLEMARAMKIPHTTTYDPVFEDDLDVARMIDEMPRFDGDAFDKNRCQIAKRYIKVFSQYGIGVRQHVKQVSNLC